MMYPFLQLADKTEIVHSEFRDDGSVKVYIEKPVPEGFKSATCFLPDNRWEDIDGFSEQDITRFKDILESSSCLIMQIAREKAGLTSDEEASLVDDMRAEYDFSQGIRNPYIERLNVQNGVSLKIRIPLKSFFDSSPVSRSQAKSICQMFEGCTEVVLDFEGLDWMGQGFAHQIFVIFRREHPDTSVIPENMTEGVEKMYRHVINTV